MKNLKSIVPVILAAAIFLAACSPQPAATPEAVMEKPAEVMEEKPAEEMMEKPTEEMMSETKSEDIADGEEAMMKESPAWFSVPLTDVNSGSEYSIKDYHGKVVLVEALAMWCSNCKKQQGEVSKLKQELGDKVVYIGFDIDPNENMDNLKDYTASNNFDWVYSVVPAEVSNELAALYGNQFLNPPSTPMLIIDSEGEVHPLPFGIKSAEQLKEFLAPFLGM
jgi:thiol-disulfide isomerase/thioredoxin